MASFGEAFSAARKAGKKTFKWSGKLYTTKTKEEEAGGGSASASTRPKARPSSPRPKARPDSTPAPKSVRKYSPTEEMKKASDAGTENAPEASIRPAARPSVQVSNAELSAAAKAAKAAGKPFSAQEYIRSKKLKIKG